MIVGYPVFWYYFEMKEKRKIKSNHNNLLNYFICDHKDLSKVYVKKSEMFLKEISDKLRKEKNENTR